MGYETVENGTHRYEKEGGMVGAVSKPGIDETKGLTSDSKSSTKIIFDLFEPEFVHIYCSLRINYPVWK